MNSSQTPLDPLSEIRARLDRKQPVEAAQLCLETLASNPDDPLLLRLLAHCEEQQSRPEQAIEHLRRAIKAQPDDVEARFELGRILASQDRVQNAQSELLAVLELDPNHAEARTVLARIEAAQGNRSGAIEGLKTALRADPDHLPAHLSLIDLLVRAGDLEKANQHASHAAALAPDNWHVQVAMARVFEAGEHFSFAEQCLRNALELAPQEIEPRLRLAALLQRSERHTEALEVLAEASSLAPESSEIRRLSALSQVRTGQLDRARQALESDPGIVNEKASLLALADVYQQQGDAMALRGLAVKLPEDQPGLARWLEGLAAAIGGNLSAATPNLEKLVAGDDDELSVRARLLLAAISLRQQENEKIRELLEPLAKTDGLPIFAVWEGARLCRESGQFELGAQLIEKALERRDLDEQARSRSAVMRLDLLDRAGRYEEAAAAFGQAAWQAPYLGEPTFLHGEDPRAVPDLGPLEDIQWPKPDPLRESEARPVFLCGWPSSGRELLMPLARCQPARALPLADWPRRRDVLHLPARPEQVTELDADLARSVRRRYFRGNAVDPGSIVFETAAIVPQDIPRLGVLFPHATLIVLHAEEKYLELQWRLAGYRQVPSMLKIWRRDDEILRQMASQVPMDRIDLDLRDLLENPESVLRGLCTRLGLRYDEHVPTVVQQLSETRGYRPPDHWENYFPG
ncbi:MAG: tetratricopeptide repeat protein [Wenzhouxiangellaceae bacterium]